MLTEEPAVITNPILPTVPHSREAEEAVVGAVLINPEIYFEIARVITDADSFYIHRNRYIWEAFGRLVVKKLDIDLLTVSDELAKVNQGDVTSSYLNSLINSVPTSLNAVSYAYIVREFYERRKGISIANKIASNAYGSNSFDLASQAELILKGASRVGNRVDANKAASEMIDLMEHSEFCTTTLPDIDKLLGGFFRAELSVLGGYAGCGKSALKQQIARKNAENGKRILLCDLEMTAAQTWFRMACGDLGYDMNSVRSGQISIKQRQEIIEYAARLGEMYQDHIVIYEAPMSPSDILSAVMLERPDMVFVDVLKNLSGRDPRGSIRDWYDYALNFLRLNIALNKDAGRPHVMVLHHLSRGAKKENRKPTKEDLMFAGESDADGIHLLHRVDEANEKRKTAVPVTWIAEKSRFGWTGEKDVSFNLPKQSFHGSAKEQ